MGLDRAPTMRSVPLIVRSKLALAPCLRFSTDRKSKVAMAMDRIVRIAVKRRAQSERHASVMTEGSLMLESPID